MEIMSECLCIKSRKYSNEFLLLKVFVFRVCLGLIAFLQVDKIGRNSLSINLVIVNEKVR